MKLSGGESTVLHQVVEKGANRNNPCEVMRLLLLVKANVSVSVQGLETKGKKLLLKNFKQELFRP